MKPAGYKALRTDIPVLRHLQHSITLSLAVHWVFQGMLYMDRTERLFKIALDAIAMALFVVGLGLSMTTLMIGFLVGHTLNFVFNAQINVVLRCFGVTRADRAALIHYLDAFTTRVSKEPSIRFAAAFGSLSREQLRDSSDIDIRVIRAPGLLYALRSCFFVMAERTRALLTGVPLDIFVLDSEQPLTKLRVDEPPTVLKQNVPTGLTGTG